LAREQRTSRPRFSQSWNGDVIPYHALSIGKELESIAHQQSNGAIVRLPKKEQIEFQSGIHEDALPPYASIDLATHARAKQILQRASDHPALYLMDTSTPLVGSPNDGGMQLNDGEGGNYIRPWAERLKEHLDFSDQLAVETLNFIAHAYGYADYQELMQEQGFQVLWPSVAAQTSLGMPHILEDHYVIPLEIAVSTADIFNTNMGAIADMLMASSPFIFGLKPADVRDYRMVIRTIFDGSWPAPFIKTTANLHRFWQHGGVDGVMYTIDRLSYQTKRPDNTMRAMIYGSTKIRVETKDWHLPLGRVESTIAGASPSLLDEIAHDGFLYLMAIAALETVASHQHPTTYFGQVYPALKHWKQRTQITAYFNTFGGNHPMVSSLIDESLSFLSYLLDHHPSLKNLIGFVKKRIHNMRLPAVASIAAYQSIPQGPISEVMMKMYQQSHAPLEIMRELHAYQFTLARELARYETRDLWAFLQENC
jgi:hypothetical protein